MDYFSKCRLIANNSLFIVVFIHVIRWMISANVDLQTTLFYCGIYSCYQVDDFSKCRLIANNSLFIVVFIHVIRQICHVTKWLLKVDHSDQQNCISTPDLFTRKDVTVCGVCLLPFQRTSQMCVSKYYQCVFV